MGKLYIVVQVDYEEHLDYMRKEVRTTFKPSVPYVFDRYDRAIKEAEKLRKARIPTFVCEFPFNPLDNRMEAMSERLKSDAEYIKHLEREVERLDRIARGDE